MADLIQLSCFSNYFRILLAIYLKGDRCWLGFVVFITFILRNSEDFFPLNYIKMLNFLQKLCSFLNLLASFLPFMMPSIFFLLLSKFLGSFNFLFLAFS